MDPDFLLTLYDYSCWATDRLLAACRQAGEDVFLTPRPELYSVSLRDTLVHILAAEWIWRSRLQEGVSPTTLLDPQDFPTLEAVIERCQVERMKMSAFLNSLSADDVKRTVHYQNTKGRPFENTLWHLMAHLVNHGTQHRSEAAVALTLLGFSPGELDMVRYFREFEA